jgi:hypothetical protein
MTKQLRRTFAIAAGLLLVACGSAYAVIAEIGPVYVSTTANLEPRELPRFGNAPVTLDSTTKIGTKDGSVPPTLKTIEFLFDKNGAIDAKGVPVCTLAKLEGTTPSQARKRCAAALVGTGTGKAQVNMPGQPRTEISSPVSFFNGPPSHGQPTLIAHAYETVPTARTLLVPIVVERVKRGRYGYRVKVEMPEIAEGFGVPTLAEAKIGAVRKRDGKKVGYIGAHCSGGRLQVYGTVTFSNGDFFPTTLTSPCHLPR